MYTAILSSDYKFVYFEENVNQVNDNYQHNYFTGQSVQIGNNTYDFPTKVELLNNEDILCLIFAGDNYVYLAEMVSKLNGKTSIKISEKPEIEEKINDLIQEYIDLTT